MARLDGLSCTQYPFILDSILTLSHLGALPSLGATRWSARIRRSPTPANNPLQRTVTWAPLLRKDSLELARERLESAVSSDNPPQHSRNARRPTSSPTPQPQAGPSRRTTVPPRSANVSSRPRAGTPPRSLLCPQPPRTGVTISPRANASSNQSAGPFRRTTVPPRPPPRTGVTISPRANVSSNQSARRSQNTNQRTPPTGQAAAPVLLLMPESALEAHERVTPDLERTGLCIICQDEEATMAAVDCGHLAMCSGCSVVVMGSSRKCSLCRRGIERLIRIYKT
ncbi:hypothetical protein DFH08DRAFT_291680 [Mycena albidolilacea]|uniref:RING-type domain-containing protein n=1 Tax=Mycena albidolilacea TaxID=1033008 RepID=A0AAD7EL79_9AGAR|nr:hypothetical protein DFH08DRAFT_291680 [Mycena albidolilacea]